MKGLFNHHRGGTTNPSAIRKVVLKTVDFTKMNGTDDSGNSNTIQPTINRNSPDSTSLVSKNAGSRDISCFVRNHRDHIANCVMVDTLGLELPDVEGVKLPSAFGRLDKKQELIAESEWSKGDMRSHTGKQSFRVRHAAKTNRLSVEGSNAMHYQGHNVVSSGDVTMTAYAMLRAVNKGHNLNLPVSTGYYLSHGRLVEVSRIDVSLLLKVPKGVAKADLINGLAIAAIKAGVNTSLYVNETVYFDQSSQIESQKIYDKEAELNRARKGGLPNHEGTKHLMALNRDTVRLEAVFRKKRLTKIAAQHGGLPHPVLFSKQMLAEMVLEQLERFICGGQVIRRLDPHELLEIPLPYRSTMAHWQNHMNLLDMVKSARVLQKHAEHLRHYHSIDISAPPPDKNMIPMLLSEILLPENFIPVPTEIRSNTQLFYEADMGAVRANLRHQVGSGIGYALIDPYRQPDEIIEVDGELRLI